MCEIQLLNKPCDMHQQHWHRAQGVGQYKYEGWCNGMGSNLLVIFFFLLNIHEFKHNNNVKINVFITKKIIPKVFNEKIRTNRNLSIYIGL